MPAPLTDVRIVALARAVCAAHRPLRLMLLRGSRRATDSRRMAERADRWQLILPQKEETPPNT